MPLVLCSVRILHLPRDRAAVLCKPGGSQGNGGRGWEHSVIGVEHHWAGQGTGAKARLRCPCTGIPLAERSLCAGVKGCPFSVHAQNPNILNQGVGLGRTSTNGASSPWGQGHAVGYPLRVSTGWNLCFWEEEGCPRGTLCSKRWFQIL